MFHHQAGYWVVSGLTNEQTTSQSVFWDAQKQEWNRDWAQAMPYFDRDDADKAAQILGSDCRVFRYRNGYVLPA